MYSKEDDKGKQKTINNYFPFSKIEWTLMNFVVVRPIQRKTIVVRRWLTPYENIGTKYNI